MTAPVYSVDWTLCDLHFEVRPDKADATSGRACLIRRGPDALRSDHAGRGMVESNPSVITKRAPVPHQQDFPPLTANPSRGDEKTHGPKKA